VTDEPTDGRAIVLGTLARLTEIIAAANRLGEAGLLDQSSEFLICAYTLEIVEERRGFNSLPGFLDRLRGYAKRLVVQEVVR
jgi:hypothetical protein